jgi:hypothetical protein
MVCFNVAARRGTSQLWGGYKGHLFAGSLTLLQASKQLLPEDHADLVQVNVQQKMDSAFSSYKGNPCLEALSILLMTPCRCFP